MTNQTAIIPTYDITRFLYTMREQRVILDKDLALLYGVTTKRLNEQYRRNLGRFPQDFAFRLTPEEWTASRSQIATGSDVALANRSQFATGSQKHRDPRFPPVAFTEHGALMAANILNLPRSGDTNEHPKSRTPATPGNPFKALCHRKNYFVKKYFGWIYLDILGLTWIWLDEPEKAKG
jgi:ORF6N domain